MVVTAVLIALFPGKQLLSDLNKNRSDRAAVEYLKTLIDKNPEQDVLKLRLINTQIALGQINEAEKGLILLLTHKVFKNEAQFILIKIYFQQYFELTQAKAKGSKKRQILSTIKQLYLQETEIKKLDLLAQWSQELGEPALAADIYAHIIQVLEDKASSHIETSQNLWSYMGINNAYADETQRVDYYIQKYLQSLLAANQLELALKKSGVYVDKFKQYQSILELAIKIAGYANAPILERNWGRLVIQRFAWNQTALTQQISRELAANEPKNSLQWAINVLKEHPNSTVLLKFTENLASNLGEKKLSQSLNLKLLAKNSHNPTLLVKAVQNEVALKDLDAALRYAQQRVKLQAKNMDAHAQLANIALWAGKPLISLQERVWLYQATKDEAQAMKAINLGKSIFQYDIVTDIYDHLGQARRLTAGELNDFYRVLQATGLSDAGVKYLKKYIKKHSEHQQAWLYLANTQSLIGDFTQAAMTLAEAEKKFGVSPSLSLLQAKIFLKENAFAKAWHSLARAETYVLPENKEFWDLYTQISWLTGHETAAAKGYQIQLAQGNIDRGLLNRLLQLRGRQKNKQQQLETLRAAWNQFKRVEYLLDAIDLSQQLKKPQQTAELMAIIDAHSQLFLKNTRYWVMKAHYVNQQNQPTLAKDYLLKALALNNQSIHTRLSLLWHLIDYGSDADLRHFLENSIQVGADQSALWEVFATSYRRLGEPLKSILWYRRAVQKESDNYLLLLNYAEALTEAGESAKAIKIQRFVMTQIRPKLVAQLAQNQVDMSEFKRRYGMVILEQFGVDVSERWLHYIEQQNQHNSVSERTIFDEYRITWMLAKGRMPQARYHILKSLHQRVNVAAWQQMAVAVDDNDLVAVERILKNPSQLLATDRVTGLRTIGKEQMALIKARNHLNDAQEEDELRIYRQQAADLGVRNPNGFAMAWQSRNISELDLWGVKSTAAITRAHNSFWIGHEYIRLSSNTHNLLVQANSATENQLTFKWQHRTLRDESWIQGRAHLRADQDLYGITIGNIHQLWRGWSINFEGAYNELAEDSAAFRVIGARDRVSLGLNGEISKREYFAINLHGRHYKSRSGHHLGLGYGVGFLVGHWLKYAQPAININLYGNLSASDLVSKLPTNVQAVVGPGRDMGSLLTKDYKEVGINLRIQDGEFRPFGFIEHRLHYYLDTGVFFNSSPSISGIGGMIAAGIGGRLFINDDLSLNIRYSSVQGGINTLPTKAFDLRYSVRFD